MTHRTGLVALFAVAALASACSDSTSASGGRDLDGADLTGSPGGADLGGAGGDLATACPRLPRPENAQRKIVVSHPYAEPSGGKAVDYEVLDLDADGTITRTATHFSMGRASMGEIVFTPDGEVGFVVQEAGSVGVFKLVEGQPPQVIEATHMRGLFAGRLAVSPAGDTLYLLDAQTTNNGGGVYALPINCDGTLGATTKLTEADLPYALLHVPGDRSLLYSRGLPNAPAEQSAHLVTLAPSFVHHTSVVTFPVDGMSSIVYGAALTSDGRYALFGDNSVFSSQQNRVGVVEITPTGLRAAQVLTPVVDPVSIVASPFNNAALVSSGFDDALLRLSYDPNDATTPFTNHGKLTYMGAKPALPASAVVITRGALKGMVYVSENVGIHKARFEPDGNITDLGKFSFGSGFTEIVGAIGVQP